MPKLLFVPKEETPETRTALTPESATALITLGLQVTIESGSGEASDYPDQAYRDVGVTITSDRNASLQNADIVLRVRKPAIDEVSSLKSGCLHISFLDPFQEKPLIQAFSTAGVSAVSMEMMPRTTLAQKMDALSSQANLAGYSAVIQAAGMINRALPMMMTPAGTIAPAKVFVIGVGVAGLQAIATAKRLGARVEAFDTRPVVEEQVKSLGAKFVKIDLGETGQTEQGYAKELTPEQIAKQREGMAKVCAQSDIVITTAKLFGRKAPVIVTSDMIARMKHGSVVVDLAAESGGNVEGTVLDKAVKTANGVTILGDGCFEGRVPFHASQVYAANLLNLISHFWSRENQNFDMRMEDEILKGCLITHGGEVVHDRFK